MGTTSTNDNPFKNRTDAELNTINLALLRTRNTNYELVKMVQKELERRKQKKNG